MFLVGSGDNLKKAIRTNANIFFLFFLLALFKVSQYELFSHHPQQKECVGDIARDGIKHPQK